MQRNRRGQRSGAAATGEKFQRWRSAGIPPSAGATGRTLSYFSRCTRPRRPPSYSPKEAARANSGSQSRQFWQRPSPISNCALEQAIAANHALRFAHRRDGGRHSGRTGIREMLLSGVSQSLQSEGKRTEKTLRRRACKGAKATARCWARSLRRPRFSVSRLLKTTLQPSDRAPIRRTSANRRRLSPGARGAMVDARPITQRARLVGDPDPVPKHRDPQYKSFDAQRATDNAGARLLPAGPRPAKPAGNEST